MDQTSFLGLRALGYGTLVQSTWIYNRAVDLEGLRRFHRNLEYGLLGRRIERSPLPFARDRWVLSRGPADIDIAPAPRPRTELSAWTYERACLPIDPEYGPTWHLGVLPLEDGGTAVSLVASHVVVDGLAFGGVVADAAEGRRHDFGYPPPGSRTRWRAVLEDGRQTLASAPELGRALAAVVRVARQGRQELTSSIASAPTAARTTGEHQAGGVPTLTAYVGLEEWKTRAKHLGGSSNSLFAGFASRLGVHMGRRLPDGTVTLAFPVGERRPGDTRGNALTFASITVDPAQVTTDLTPIRGQLKQALTALSTTPNEMLETLPLSALTPKWVARRLVGMSLGTSAAPIGCSNLGVLDPAVNRPDGTEADYSAGRLIEPTVAIATLERIGGQLFIGSGAAAGKVFITVVAYRAGGPNSREDLREVVSRAFAEFELTAEIEN